MLWLCTISIGALVFVLTVWFKFQISNWHVLRLCRAIPVARPYYPVLGNALLFACSLEKTTKKVQEILEESVLKGQRAVCFWIGAYPLTFITDPEDIKTILNNSLSRGKEMEESCKEFAKHGLFTSPVDHWKVTRRYLNMSFHPRNLEQLMPTFNITSRQLVDELSGYVGGAVFNIMPHVMTAALRNICIFLYGPRTMEFVSAEQFNNLRHAIELAAELVALRMTRPWLNIGIVFKLLYGKELDTVKTAFCRILEIANTNSVHGEISFDKKENAGNVNTQDAFQTIIDAMRELQERVTYVTDQHVMEEMVSFFATGTDTIGVSVSSCLLALARYPHIQDKVHEEIRSVMSGDDEYISHADLKRLAYLDQVIKETLRFFIVVPFSSRAPNRNIDLNGYTLPANNLTALFLSAVCFDPKYFPDPYKFDPDRFLTRNSSEDVFIPFSRGPRNCIGKTYAMMVMKVMVAHVVRKYKISTNMDIQNLKKKFMITVTCCDGYSVSLRKTRE